MELVEFKDSGFEKIVRAALKKPDGNLIKEDLISLKGVLIADNDVSEIQIPWLCNADAYNMTFPEVIFNVNDSENGKWIEDLKQFKLIKSLHLYVTVDDLSFLNEFTALKELYISESNEPDWSFVENMIALRYLWVYNCPFF